MKRNTFSRLVQWQGLVWGKIELKSLACNSVGAFCCLASHQTTEEQERARIMESIWCFVCRCQTSRNFSLTGEKSDVVVVDWFPLLVSFRSGEQGLVEGEKEAFVPPFHPSKPLVAYFSWQAQSSSNIKKKVQLGFSLFKRKSAHGAQNVNEENTNPRVKSKYDLFARARYNIYNVNES